ncbi:DUF1553 domain-containing protein [Rohdeia mirabilis]|uniref:PSD1 and planctomycete cytochrome C domain-containing protein n=1 Tax=Rohdeia mirabilis TaxID=2528008 RepID=UPI003AF38669
MPAALVHAGSSLLALVALGTALSAAEDDAPASAPLGTPAEAERSIDFEREIRPILADTCFACHGPDAETRAADLRLDTREGLFGDRGGYAPVVPGDPGASELLLRITDPLDAMPPPLFGKTVAPEHVELLRRWIEQGAQWSGHWAFEPVERPQPPAVDAAHGSVSPVDAFVLAQLDAAGLAPSPRADRASLLRRVTFDLTGLPPTPAELDAFLADTEPGAYERVVDRLLASEAYGERQTQDWLDLSRYADSDGDGKDGPRSMWKWRDWVIDAFNSNKPYDEFVVEQLAGDLLPDATDAQKIATGFNRNHFIYTKFGAEKDEYRTAYVVDRVNTTSTVFMGLTMGCAQCHDHKYDPISHEDYYRVFAFFNNVAESDVGSSFGNSAPRMVVAEGETRERLATLNARIEELEAYFEADDEARDADQAAWEAERAAQLDDVEWTTVEPVGLLSQNGAFLNVLEDGSILASGPSPSSDVYHVVARPGAARIVALRLEALPDESFPEGRSGRSMDGTFNLSELEVHVRSILEGDDGDQLEFILGESSVGGSRSSADGAVDGSDRNGWSVPKSFAGEVQDGVFVLEEPLELKDPDVIRFRVDQSASRSYNQTLGRFRLSFTADERVLERRVPLRPSVWRAVGPFAATSASNAHTTVYPPQERIASEDGFDFEERYDPIDVKALQKEEREAKKAAEKAAEEAAEAAAEAEAAGAVPASDAAPREAAPSEAERSSDAASDGRNVDAERHEVVQGPSVEASGIVFEDVRSDGVVLDGSTVDEDILEHLIRDTDFLREEAVSAATRTRDLATAEANVTVADTLEGARSVAADRDTPVAGSGLAFAMQLAAAKKARSATRDRSAAPARESAMAPAEAPTPDATGDAAPISKPSGDEPDAKPAAATEEKPDPKPEPSSDDSGTSSRRGRGQDEDKLGWEEKRDWRTDGSIRLSGRYSAYYLHRTFAPTVDREVALRFTGADAMTIWLDGEQIFERAPEVAEEAGDASEKSGDEKSGDEDDGEAEEDDGAFQFDRGDLTEYETFRFALTAGEHELVVKLVTGRTGARATLQFQAMGSDVAPYEVERAILTAEADSASIAAEPVDEAPQEEDDEFSFFGGGESSESPARARRGWVREWFRRHVSDEGRELYEELQLARREVSAMERQLPSVMVMRERETPRETHVLLRGEYDRKGALVTAGVPAVLPPLPEGAPEDRLGLARWLVSGEHPLTARVAVNRAWQQHFGRPLVSTPGDFGVRGALPSHPRLLDWLAAEFVESGWDVKALHRTIVTSATYQQSSRITARHLERDPDNVLLARAPRGRLSAEMIRDNALSVSGLLVSEIGGESVKPVQPKGLWRAQSMFQSYKPDKGDALYRRGIYVYWKRATLYPSFEAFDAPARLTCAVERSETTTPLQSLVLLNDPVYVEAARFLGQRMILDGGTSTAGRLAFGFRLCTSRMPTDEELTILLQIHADQLAVYTADEKAAKKLIKIGSKDPDESLEPIELATWTALGTVLLNLDSTIHKR